MGDQIRNWLTTAGILAVALCYVAAVAGVIGPSPTSQLLARLEPIIFVLIGYHLGRRPSQQNENTLKQEISRQTQRADAAQHAKEQAQQAREALEEQMKNVRAALVAPPFDVKDPAARPRGHEGFDDKAFRRSVAAALNILNS